MISRFEVRFTARSPHASPPRLLLNYHLPKKQFQLRLMFHLSARSEEHVMGSI
jgi:hypothetical protein